MDFALQTREICYYVNGNDCKNAQQQFDHLLYTTNVDFLYIYILHMTSDSQTKVTETTVLLFNALLECSSGLTNNPFVFSGDYFDSGQGGTHSH